MEIFQLVKYLELPRKLVVHGYYNVINDMLTSG